MQLHFYIHTETFRNHRIKLLNYFRYTIYKSKTMNPLKLLLPSCLLVTTMLVLVDGFYPPLPKIFDPESFVKPQSDCGALVELYGAVKKALDEYCSKTGKHGE